MTGVERTACPVVLAAPSGTGKTTIAHALVDDSDRYAFSVSATTRSPREGEVDEVDYLFVSEDRFRSMIADGELVEWAEVHGHFYGTPVRNLVDGTRKGIHVVLDIDVQGAAQIKEKVPEAILVFIFPPSARALRDRLMGRDTERSEEVARRLTNARKELEFAAAFDYVVVNDELEVAVETVRKIVESEGHRPERAADLAGDVERLRGEIDEILSDEPFRGEGE